ncbi:MAG TPA: hypothetical protein PK897_08170, partial [Treponema sp.]|nr:hypothetical protein [Treponema sp.]
LNRIPEVTEAHQYFLNRALNEREQSLKRALTALSRASSARNNKDYTAASLAYGEALQALGLSAEESLQVTQGISALAVEQNKAQLSAADTNEARNLIRRGKNELDERKWTEAIKTYASLLRKYPNAEQTGSALEGIDTAVLNLIRENEQTKDEFNRNIAELEKRVTQLTAELSTLRTTSDKGVQDKDKQIAELERLLEEERQRSKTAAAQTAAGPAGAGMPQNTTTLEQDLAALRTENERLTQIVKQYDTLNQAYQRYQQEEDRIVAGGGSGSLIAARAQLDTFLTNSEVQRVFPDLRERIQRYERAFIEAGQKESLYNAMTIADTAFKLKDAASRSRYFQDLASRYRDNQAMLTYIEALQRGLR